MSHDCPDCGELCYCDMEDHLYGDADDCLHWASGDCVQEVYREEEQYWNEEQ